MNREHSITAGVALCAMVAALFVCGCGAALAPGYTVVKESRTVEFVPGSPAALKVNLQYGLKNTGTTALDFVDVTFPDARTFGTRDVRVQWDGHPIDLRAVPEDYRQDEPNTRRIQFEAPWARGRTGKLDIDYAFRSPADPGARITIGDETFHLGSLGWTALPQAPKHFLAPFPARPPRMTYTVRAPAGFRVLGRGKLKHRKTRNNEAEYEFQLNKNDLAPFIVAGRYIEKRVAGGSVVFWTLHPLTESMGASPQRIGRAWATLEKDFGPIDTEGHVPHIVEAPKLRPQPVEGAGPAVAAFPGGALVNEQTLALGIASDAFIERVTHALAHNWFSDQMYPNPDAAIGIGEGLADYATIVIDEASGGAAARRSRAEHFLSRYNDARKHAKEKPLGVTTATDPPGQRAIAVAKAPLMYVALEDTCGERPVRDGLKNLVSIMRGQEVDFDDLRSAMEQTCGKDLGGFFRTWLYGQGLPQDFATRYESSATP